MSLEAEAFLLGIWKDFEEMEMNLTMEELNLILEAKSRIDMRNWKFQASLKGISLDDEMTQDTGSEPGVVRTVEDKIKQMQARQMGVDDETFDFQQMGIKVIKE